MKSLGYRLQPCVLSLCCAVSVGWTPATAQTAAQSTAHAPDGAVRQTLQSISVPSLVNAPFTATVITEWTRLMPDGSTATIYNQRTIARDNSGRIFQERRYLTPNGDKVQPPLSNLEFTDPGRHEFYDCIPNEQTCYVSRYFGAALTSLPVNEGSADGGQSALGTVRREALGQTTMQGLDAVGSREITAIAQGAIGNEKVEPIVKEFWYSPYLGVNLAVKRFDPRSGIANFTVSNVQLSEPDPQLFDPPQSYRVVPMTRRGLLR